jgi:hypothetical protein
MSPTICANGLMTRLVYSRLDYHKESRMLYWRSRLIGRVLTELLSDPTPSLNWAITRSALWSGATGSTARASSILVSPESSVTV